MPEMNKLHPLGRGWRCRWLVVWLLLTCMFTAANADPVFDMAKGYFPQADSVGEFEGDPLAAQVHQGKRLLGYVIRTTDIAPIPAYSGEPITLLVGLDLQGRIAGLDILKHSEPILVVGISEQDLKHYIDQYQGVSVLERVKLGGAQREGYPTMSRWCSDQ